MRENTGRSPPRQSSPAAGNGTRGVEAVPWLDLERYVGRWYGIAWLPLPFQRLCEGELEVEYALRDDGLIAVRSVCRRAGGPSRETHGAARQPEPLREPAKLQVRFAPAWLHRMRFVWKEHWVIGLDRDYGWAIVGEPQRRYLWILGREERMDYHLLEELKSVARRMGYDLAPLRAARRRGD